MATAGIALVVEDVKRGPRLLFRHPPVPNAPLLASDNHMDMFSRLFRSKALAKGEGGVGELVIDDVTFVACSKQPLRPANEASRATAPQTAPEESEQGSPTTTTAHFDEDDLDDVWEETQATALDTIAELGGHKLSSTDSATIRRRSAAPRSSAVSLPRPISDKSTTTTASASASGAGAETAQSATGQIATLTLILVVDHGAGGVSRSTSHRPTSAWCHNPASTDIKPPSHTCSGALRVHRPTRPGIATCARLLTTALALEEGRIEYVSQQAAIMMAARDMYRHSATRKHPSASLARTSVSSTSGVGSGTSLPISSGKIVSSSTAAAAASSGSGSQGLLGSDPDPSLSSSTAVPSSTATTTPPASAATASSSALMPLTETGAHDAVLAVSSLARELVLALDGLVTRGEAHVTINSWLPVSLCVATATMTSLHGVKTAMSSRSRRLAAELAPHLNQQQRQQDASAALTSTTPSSEAPVESAASVGAATVVRDDLLGPLRPLSLGEPPLSSRLRPFHALLLLDDASAVLASLPVGVTEGMRALIGAASPLRSLQQLQLATGIDELHLLRVAEHLVVWGRATPIPVITRSARFVTAAGAVSLSGPAVRARLSEAGPWGIGVSMELGQAASPSQKAHQHHAEGAADGKPIDSSAGAETTEDDVMVMIPGVAQGSSLAIAFDQAFVRNHGVVPLAQVLQVLSKPRSLEEVVLLLQPRARPAAMDVLVWLLRRGLLDRVRENLLLLPSADVAPSLCWRLAEQDAANQGAASISAQSVWEATRSEAAAAVAARRDTGPDTPSLPTGGSLLDAATSAAALLLALAADASPHDPLRDIIDGSDGPRKSDSWRRRHRVLATFVQIAPFCDGQHDVAELLWRTSLAQGDVNLVCEMLPDLVVRLDS